MSLRSVNLNLIPVLQALLRERGVASAAVALDMSAPATSEALGRLRVLLSDPLLVKVGRAMQLTPKAAELIEPVNRLCDEAERLLHVGEKFEPHSSKRQFKIAANDCIVFLMSLQILAAVRAAAPSVQIHFCDPQPDSVEQLSARSIDCLLMPRFFLEDVPNSMPIHTRTILRDELVLVFSSRHPLASQAQVTREDLAAYPQVLYHPVKVALEGKREHEALGGVPFNVSVRVAQLTMIPHLVADPPYIAWIQKSLALRLKSSLHLEIRPGPESSGDHNVCLAWSPIHHRDLAHRWFRDLITKSLAPRAPGGDATPCLVPATAD